MAPKFLAYTIEPIIPPRPNTTPTTQVENTISQFIGVLTIAAVIYFAIQIILAGFAYLSSEGDKAKLEQARRRLTNSVLGLFIVIIAVGLTALIATLTGIPNIFSLNQMFSQMGL